MSNNFDNRNSGAVFKNDKMRTDKSPNMTGSCEIECPHCGAQSKFWVSIWFKLAKSGKKFMSLAFTPDDKEVNKKVADNTNRDWDKDFDFDDDIPF
ncbi:hypothetical protein [Alteromonas phage ZP6]|uniref:Putative single-stranded DNA-binding protein n=1 Tax=Alteromonas phage ZP6 TaxID=2492447 RepID=A0A3S9U8J3_9CAUD|nr:hypothetical protein PQC03_gp26 [Alteromonas phage ZP6]AZS06529.1 hypothetical protein [Alteromonas phage ZP6]